MSPDIVSVIFALRTSRSAEPRGRARRCPVSWASTAGVSVTGSTRRPISRQSSASPSRAVASRDALALSRDKTLAMSPFDGDLAGARAPQAAPNPCPKIVERTGPSFLK